MSYDPSYRQPPRQDRWPNATPQEPWPAYSGAETYRETAGYRGWRQAADSYQGSGYQDSGYQDSGYQDSGYQNTGAGYWNGNGYDRDNGYDRSYGNGGVVADYGDAWDGAYGDQEGYAGATGDFAGPDLEPAPTGALLIAPDT